MMIFVFDREENMGKGENAGYHHLCGKELMFAKPSIFQVINPLPGDKF